MGNDDDRSRQRGIRHCRCGRAGLAGRWRDDGGNDGDRQLAADSRFAFEPANTIASLLAANFAEATDEMYLSALIEIGLVLFLVTFIINAFAKL